MTTNGKGLLSIHFGRIMSILGLISITSILPFQLIPSVDIPSPIEEQINASANFPKRTLKSASKLVESPSVTQRQHPRVLQFDAETNSATMPRLETIPNLQPGKTPKKAISSSSSEDEYEPTCQPMHEWQTRTYPACNSVHEVNMRPESGSVIFINCKLSRSSVSAGEIC